MEGMGGDVIGIDGPRSKADGPVKIPWQRLEWCGCAEILGAVAGFRTASHDVASSKNSIKQHICTLS